MHHYSVTVFRSYGQGKQLTTGPGTTAMELTLFHRSQCRCTEDLLHEDQSDLRQEGK